MHAAKWLTNSALGAAYTPNIAPDDPRLATLSPSYEFQLRVKAKELIIEESMDEGKRKATVAANEAEERRMKEEAERLKKRKREEAAKWEGESLSRVVGLGHSYQTTGVRLLSGLRNNVYLHAREHMLTHMIILGCLQFSPFPTFLLQKHETQESATGATTITQTKSGRKRRPRSLSTSWARHYTNTHSERICCIRVLRMYGCTTDECLQIIFISCKSTGVIHPQVRLAGIRDSMLLMEVTAEPIRC